MNSHALVASARPKLQLALDEDHDEGMAIASTPDVGRPEDRPDAEERPAATRAAAQTIEN